MCKSSCCKSSCCKSYSYCKPTTCYTECVEVVPKIELKQCYDVVCKEKVVRYNEVVPRLEVKQSYDIKSSCCPVSYCEPACCNPCYSYPPCHYQATAQHSQASNIKNFIYLKQKPMIFKTYILLFISVSILETLELAFYFLANFVIYYAFFPNFISF